MEVVAGRLDLLLCLESKLVNCAGSVLNDTVNLERAAHDHGFSRFLFSLCFAGSVLGVDCTNGSG